ncbi:MAG TPA: hypothetical protein VKE69_12165, partial [Planctomycetota bacterium]|nr:hypothetical protein [Planctomycetota bacterium]
MTVGFARAAAAALAALLAACSSPLTAEELDRIQGFPGAPGDASLYDQAQSQFSRGKVREALAIAVELRDRHPQNVLVHRLYQEAMIRLDQRAQVVDEYERLARTRPSALYDALLSRLQTEADRGAALAQSSVERDDRFSWGWYARGWWESKRKPPRFDEARAAYERALELQPDLVPALRAYANLVRDKEPEAALDAIRRAIALHPERRSERMFLASVQLHLGEDEAREAEKMFRALLDERPGDLDASKGLAAA